MPHDNETCQSCRYFPVIYDGDCRHPEMENEKGWPDLRDRCDEFKPSMECRKVQALEEIARQLKTGPSRAAVVLVNDKGEVQPTPPDQEPWNSHRRL